MHNNPFVEKLEPETKESFIFQLNHKDSAEADGQL